MDKSRDDLSDYEYGEPKLVYSIAKNRTKNDFDFFYSFFKCFRKEIVLYNKFNNVNVVYHKVFNYIYTTDGLHCEGKHNPENKEYPIDGDYFTSDLNWYCCCCWNCRYYVCDNCCIDNKESVNNIII